MALSFRSRLSKCWHLTTTSIISRTHLWSNNNNAVQHFITIHKPSISLYMYLFCVHVLSQGSITYIITNGNVIEQLHTTELFQKLEMSKQNILKLVNEWQRNLLILMARSSLKFDEIIFVKMQKKNLQKQFFFEKKRSKWILTKWNVVQVSSDALCENWFHEVS